MNPPPFPIGHIVVCVSRDIPSIALQSFTTLPRFGERYTVSDMAWAAHHLSGETSLGIRLREIPLRPDRQHPRPWFGLVHFRLLEDLLELEAQLHPIALSV